jgi:hypothetical protein
MRSVRLNSVRAPLEALEGLLVRLLRHPNGSSKDGDMTVAEEERVPECGRADCNASVAAPDSADPIWRLLCERHAESFERMVEAAAKDV